ncbi:MAG TPA: hypothetical protein DEP84_16350, partial [Chloroflexi bacterium]|nr:hypothetical protein [Chloroflexota bacterium]
MTARPQKADVIVIGGGLAAHALALLLTRKGRRVALLAERRPLPAALPDFVLWQPAGPRLTAALRGGETLDALIESLPGLTWTRLEARLRLAPEDERELAARLALAGERHRTMRAPGRSPLLHGVLFETGQALPAMAQAIEAGGGIVERAARVRGISVIGDEVLGAVSDAARWDALAVVNAADDERAMAMARMAREPLDLTFVPSPLVHCQPSDEAAAATLHGDALWSDGTGGVYLLGDSPLLQPAAACRTLAMVTRSALTQPVLV